jgi:protein-L-isoaspartate(D-aspartate) O-methyltransferase
MDNDCSSQRTAMVADQIAARGVKDPRVLAALGKIPRHLFIPEANRGFAYEDEPVPIGDGQTISQPYIVAFMTEALRLKGGERVLEIGTGSGYQTAVLAEIAAEVFTVEIVAELAERARARLAGMGYANIRYRIGNGASGWREFAPYDAILAGAAPAAVPPALKEQLKVGGRLVLPVGTGPQELWRIVRRPEGFREEPLMGVRFVPLVQEEEGENR